MQTMNKLEIVQYPNEILRQVAEKIELNDTETRAVLKQMAEYVKDPVSKAAGLALPQVGISKRGFVALVEGKVEIFINPIFKSIDGKVTIESEGCLSVDEKSQVEFPRAKNIKVTYRTIDNKIVTGRKLSNWDARVFLHELDHLDGKLFIDYIK